MNRANFERIATTKPRRSAEAQAAFETRKGKHNKTKRPARFEWDYGVHHKTNVGAPAGRYLGESL